MYSGGQPGGGGGHNGKISLGPFCHFFPSPAGPASRLFRQEEVKQLHCRDTQRPKVMKFWGALGHQITCHSPPFPVCQNIATTVARTSLKKQPL